MRYALFLLTLGVSAAAELMPPAGDQQLAREIYKQIVEIKSGYSSGATTPVAEAVAARLKSEGFPDSDIFVGGAAPAKANLVVRYHGSGARKPILLLAHTDVVEAKREDWSMDPFTLTEKDGYFYGRGSSDDKAQAAVWIANLIRYKRENFHPDRDIIVALTADEEGGGPYNGVAWLLKNHRELIDADLALNEGGRGEMLQGKRIANDVQVAEKYVVNFRLEVHNKGGHSSLPVPDNAIYHLAGALERLSHFGFPLKNDDVTRAYFGQLSKIETGSIAAELAGVAADSQPAMEHVAAASPMWNSMLRTTCVATQIEGGHARNALPQLAAATINCRVRPEDAVEYVQEALAKVFNDEQVSIKVLDEVVRGPASPLNAHLMHTIARVTDDLWPGVPVLPVLLTGATDGLYLRSAGIPTYGVQGFFYERDDNRAHGRDERILVRSFYEGQTFLYDLVKALSLPGA
ncbi:MAG: M20/M25/M40 family metallo-hydrolase [Acidobacteriaceae bacterium]|nr:M20/M25/M40 family metallo-hydrolase [Acidobacteriaceae bacterium]MBV8569797.1 M20/M25/M40 family metallo-hydrolase [Acidobacteriaceae bacterium]